MADSAIVLPAVRDGWHIGAVTIANQFPLGAGLSTDTTFDLGAYAVHLRVAPGQRRHVQLLIRPEAWGWPVWRIAMHTAGVRYGDGTRELGVSVLGATFAPTTTPMQPRPGLVIVVLLPCLALWAFFRFVAGTRNAVACACVSVFILCLTAGSVSPSIWPLVLHWGAVWLLAALLVAGCLRLLGIWADSALSRGVLVAAAGGALAPLMLRLLGIAGVPITAALAIQSVPWAVAIALILIVIVLRVPLRLPTTLHVRSPRGARWWTYGVAGLSVLLIARTIQTAWISDDAQITLRTVMNALHGYGLTFNLAERVQAYTHTLWFFVLWGTSLLTGNIYIATFCASMICAALTVVVLVRWVARPRAGLWVGLGALVLSKAYIDYSTSGLENPLTHLLLVCAIMLGDMVLFRRKTALLPGFVTIMGLIFLNRPDAVLLLAPFAGYVFWMVRTTVRNKLRALALGVLPVVLWTCFSIWYYGFPFPNTAYAKVGTGIAPLELLVQAGHYFGQTLIHDPLTLVVIGLTLLLSIRARWYERSIALGIVGYVAAMTVVGGDFMQGRFFAAPLLLAVVLLSRIPVPQPSMRLLAAIVVSLGIVGQAQPVRSGYEDIQAGIADERAFYAPRFGLYTADAATFQQPDWSLGTPRFVALCGGVGRTGLFFGPSLHILDSCALTDPLLSKLPARYDPEWRIGHFYRLIPTMYFDSIMRDQNTLTDPALTAYYDAIRLATRGNLWSTARLRTILALNLGRTSVPPAGIYRTMCVPFTRGDWHVPARWLANPVYGGRRGTAGNLVFLDAMTVDLDAPQTITSVDFSINDNDDYLIDAITTHGRVPMAHITPSGPAPQYGPALLPLIVKREHAGVMVRYTVSFLQPVRGVQTIAFRGRAGDGRYSVGHVLVNR